jgi:hypothetical protein
MAWRVACKGGYGVGCVGKGVPRNCCDIVLGGIPERLVGSYHSAVMATAEIGGDSGNSNEYSRALSESAHNRNQVGTAYTDQTTLAAIG